MPISMRDHIQLADSTGAVVRYFNKLSVLTTDNPALRQHAIELEAYMRANTAALVTITRILKGLP